MESLGQIAVIGIGAFVLSKAQEPAQDTQVTNDSFDEPLHVDPWHVSPHSDESQGHSIEDAHRAYKARRAWKAKHHPGVQAGFGAVVV